MKFRNRDYKKHCCIFSADTTIDRKRSPRNAKSTRGVSLLGILSNSFSLYNHKLNATCESFIRLQLGSFRNKQKKTRQNNVHICIWCISDNTYNSLLICVCVRYLRLALKFWAQITTSSTKSTKMNKNDDMIETGWWYVTLEAKKTKKTMRKEGNYNKRDL